MVFAKCAAILSKPRCVKKRTADINAIYVKIKVDEKAGNDWWSYIIKLLCINGDAVGTQRFKKFE